MERGAWGSGGGGARFHSLICLPEPSPQGVPPRFHPAFAALPSLANAWNDSLHPTTLPSSSPVAQSPPRPARQCAEASVRRQIAPAGNCGTCKKPDQCFRRLSGRSQ